MIKELEFLQLDLGLVHFLDSLIRDSVVIAENGLAVMHEMVEQIHNCVLAFLLGLHAHLRVFAEIDQVRHPILFYLKFYSDELVSGLAFLYLCVSELSDVLVILILPFSLDRQLVAQHEVLPLSLEVLP